MRGLLMSDVSFARPSEEGIQSTHPMHWEPQTWYMMQSILLCLWTVLCHGLPLPYWFIINFKLCLVHIPSKLLWCFQKAKPACQMKLFRINIFSLVFASHLIYTNLYRISPCCGAVATALQWVARFFAIVLGVLIIALMKDHPCHVTMFFPQHHHLMQWWPQLMKDHPPLPTLPSNSNCRPERSPLPCPSQNTTVQCNCHPD